MIPISGRVDPHLRAGTILQGFREDFSPNAWWVIFCRVSGSTYHAILRTEQKDKDFFVARNKMLRAARIGQPIIGYRETTTCMAGLMAEKIRHPERFAGDTGYDIDLYRERRVLREEWMQILGSKRRLNLRDLAGLEFSLESHSEKSLVRMISDGDLSIDWRLVRDGAFQPKDFANKYAPPLVDHLAALVALANYTPNAPREEE